MDALTSARFAAISLRNSIALGPIQGSRNLVDGNGVDPGALWETARLHAGEMTPFPSEQAYELVSASDEMVVIESARRCGLRAGRPI
jgi:hypothetical protein